MREADRIDEKREVIDMFVRELCPASGEEFTLKGGTGLMYGHGLDRFSEDIDLDSPASRAGSSTLFERARGLADEMGYGFRVGKDTDLVKKCFIRYSEDEKPLKIECSFRRREIPESAVDKRSGIRLYDIDSLALMKSSAYQSRDKIRDLYDLSYICSTKHHELSYGTIESVRNAFEYKGIEQFDYLVKTQPDDLIDEKKMESYFLDSIDRLGLFDNALARDRGCEREEEPEERERDEEYDESEDENREEEQEEYHEEEIDRFR